MSQPEAASPLVVTLTVLPIGFPATVSCTDGDAASGSPLVNGVASFSGCSFSLAPHAPLAADSTLVVTLQASVDGIFAAETGPITLLADRNAPTGLGFVAQVSGAAPGQPFARQPIVAVQNPLGATVTGTVWAVKLSLIAPAAAVSPGALQGVLTNCIPMPGNAATTLGLYSFSGCRIDVPGFGYVLRADGTATIGGQQKTLAGHSAPFAVAPRGVPALLAFSVVPEGLAHGRNFTKQPRVVVQDVFGMPVVGGAIAVSLQLVSAHSRGGGSSSNGMSNSDASGVGSFAGAPPPAGRLSCSAQHVLTVRGVAQFEGCRIEGQGAYFKLIASATSNVGVGVGSRVLVVETPALAVMSSSGRAAGLVFATPLTVDQASFGVGSAFAVRVSVVDAFGAVVTSATNRVTLAKKSTSPTGQASGLDSPVSAGSGGVAVFSVSFDAPGRGFVLQATSPGISSAESVAITIVGAATKLAFAQQPSGGLIDGVLARQPIVEVQVKPHFVLCG